MKLLRACWRDDEVLLQLLNTPKPPLKKLQEDCLRALAV